MNVRYLERRIVEVRLTDRPRWGVAADGYTIKTGAPTSLIIRLEGEKRWRRLMIWQFSNAGTCFIRTKDGPLVVRNCDIPEASDAQRD